VVRIVNGTNSLVIFVESVPILSAKIKHIEIKPCKSMQERAKVGGFFIRRSVVWSNRLVLNDRLKTLDAKTIFLEERCNKTCLEEPFYRATHRTIMTRKIRTITASPLDTVIATSSTTESTSHHTKTRYTTSKIRPHIVTVSRCRSNCPLTNVVHLVFSGPAVWNSLPEHCRDSGIFAAFQR